MSRADLSAPVQPPAGSRACREPHHQMLSWLKMMRAAEIMSRADPSAPLQPPVGSRERREPQQWMLSWLRMMMKRAL